MTSNAGMTAMTATKADIISIDRSRGATTMVVSKRDDLGDSSDEPDTNITIPKKFKADTDHKNLLFEQSIKQRSHAAS